MRASVGILAIAICLGTSGCVVTEQAVFEYPLSKCPPTEFLLPALAKDEETAARYVSSDAQCRGAALYELSEGRDSEQLHVRIDRGDRCSLLVASIYPKVCRGLLPAECSHFKTTTAALTEKHVRLAKLLLRDQSISVETAPKRVEVIKSKGDFEKWCTEKSK